MDDGRTVYSRFVVGWAVSAISVKNTSAVVWPHYVNGSAGPGSHVRSATARRRSQVEDREQPRLRRESDRQGRDAASQWNGSRVRLDASTELPALGPRVARRLSTRPAGPAARLSPSRPESQAPTGRSATATAPCPSPRGPERHVASAATFRQDSRARCACRGGASRFLDVPRDQLAARHRYVPQDAHAIGHHTEPAIRSLWRSGGHHVSDGFAAAGNPNRFASVANALQYRQAGRLELRDRHRLHHS